MGFTNWNYARKVDSDAFSLYTPSDVVALTLKRVAGNASTYVHTENGTNPHIRMINGDSLILDTGDGSIYIVPGSDLAITPGSGFYVKFGTRTATGDVACNGHLDIKDSAGNVVKLMTTA